MKPVAALRVHYFLPISEVNGPGRRSVLWVQGCTLHCPGCWNEETWDPSGGTVEGLDHLLSQVPLGVVEGITFSGGEPFLQAPSCAALARSCRELGLSVMTYTGYRYEDLATKPEAGPLLSATDILVDGPYLQDEPSTHPWAGSGNQRVLRLSGGVITEVEKPQDHPAARAEVHILKDGTIVTTGFPREDQ